MTKKTESDLYDPVANYLRNLGYEVRGEVRSIDLVAIHETELVVVELKLRMSLDLILQAVERQRTADSVYVAVAARSSGPAIRNHRRIRRLLRRLELGLILVHFRICYRSVRIFYRCSCVFLFFKQPRPFLSSLWFLI